MNCPFLATISVTLGLALAAPAAAQSSSAEAVLQSDYRAELERARALNGKGDCGAISNVLRGLKPGSPAVGLMLNLADCYEKLGNYRAAEREFETAARIARALGDQRADTVDEHARELAQYLDLSILPLYRRTPPAPQPVSIQVDDAVIFDRAQAVDAWTALDPGRHSVVMRSGERELFRQDVVAPADGGRLPAIELISRSQPPAASIPNMTRAARSAARERVGGSIETGKPSTATHDIALFASGIATGIALLGSAVTGLEAHRLREQFNHLNSDPASSEQERVDARRRARDAQVGNAICLAATGIGATATALIYLYRVKPRQAPTSGIAPWVSRSAAGIVVHGDL